MNARDWALLLALSVLWGGSFFFIGVAVQHLPPLTIVTVRVVLAALVLLLVLRLRNLRLPREARVWWAFLGMGLLNNAIPFTLIVWGQSHIASGLAAILNATTPFFTVLVAHRFTADERMTPMKLAGVIIGLAGVVAMIGGGAIQSVGQHLAAQLSCLLAALVYALAGVFGRRFRAMNIAPLATATGQTICSSLLLVPLALAVDRPWTLPPAPAETWLALAGLATLSTALAYIIYFRLLASAGATNLQLVTLLIPASAILLGGALLQESLEPRHLAGMLTIALGLVVIDGRLFQWLRHAAPRDAGREGMR